MLPNITTLEGITIGSEIYAPSYTRLGTPEIIDGCEVFSMNNIGDSASTSPNKPIIVTNGVDHNLYLNNATMLGDHNFINELCIFLDNVPSGTVNFYLGSSIDDSFTISISSIIASMQRLIEQGITVNTHAYGFCSIPETMIWTYGKNRSIGNYGAIRFGGGEWIRRMRQAFHPYMTTYMNHCKSIGVLTDEQIEDIMVKQHEIMYIQEDGQLKAV